MRLSFFIVSEVPRLIDICAKFIERDRFNNNYRIDLLDDECKQLMMSYSRHGLVMFKQVHALKASDHYRFISLVVKYHPGVFEELESKQSGAFMTPCKPIFQKIFLDVEKGEIISKGKYEPIGPIDYLYFYTNLIIDTKNLKFYEINLRSFEERKLKYGIVRNDRIVVNEASNMNEHIIKEKFCSNPSMYGLVSCAAYIID
jgi:hypothetical protein